ncbi:quinone oxidoreductase, YhdH/YhfP family [Flexistipes sinusarabici DSM 4947]|uniref:Quinone oxidoreductase, YhdH/YhfP family n=1 Tax=Flexistipes sinusarabici (strain ATCC 49648 / DSM 4947 / MAS 10) TaxID=717231 RepID=F8E494_FLESM|nr:YhdH/YhfP family quinone oxidoreductase [Flexistipes sinusarabici]AEI15521.1 quinone oxidoreductase, YhdH/YhfP family [Flexistipes sinusarabici DSM 4947]
MSEKFKAMVISKQGDKFIREIKEKSVEELPEGDVLIKVHYSSLNFKDALSAIGNKGVTRNFPHTPGIDAAGIVQNSKDSTFKEGDEVLVTGFDLGMETDGGFGQFIRVPAEWVVKLPEGLSLRESMIFGTAGFTAGLSVFALAENNTTPEDGEVLVTGSTGGVGSMAIAILSQAGYDLVAVTGKKEKEDFLKELGAIRVISREEADDQSGKPMLKGVWGGAVDTVGGNILATAIKSTKYSGTVTTCGLTQSTEFTSSVFPFILRGVKLIGIDSVQLPMDRRLPVWDKLANEWKPDSLETLTNEIGLEEVSDNIDLILKGKLTGRTLINLWK